MVKRVSRLFGETERWITAINWSNTCKLWKLAESLVKNLLWLLQPGSGQSVVRRMPSKTMEGVWCGRKLRWVTGRGGWD